MTSATVPGSFRRDDPSGRGTAELRWIVVAVALAPLLSLLSDAPSPIPFDVRLTAYLAWLATLWPAWSYLGLPAERRPPIPFMPMVGVFFGMYFALQIALGQANEFYRIVAGVTPRLDPASDYAPPINLFLAGWLLLLLAWAVARRIPDSRGRPEADEDLSQHRHTALLLALTGLALDSLAAVGRAPGGSTGLVAFLSNCGLLGTAILVVLNARRQLSTRGRLALLAVVLADAAVRIVGGTIATAAVLLIVLLAASWIGIGRIRRRTLVVAIACACAWITVKGLVNQYRKETWLANRQVGLVERTRILIALSQLSLRSHGLAGSFAAGTEAVVARSATIDEFADVMRRTPGEVPYWDGDSYAALAGALVPRFLWPDKPTMELGQAFGHRYHYLGSRDFHTSVNLPYLVEFYANFGAEGVLAGMFLVGVIFGLLEGLANRPGQAVLSSVGGLILMIPLLNIESDFGLNFGGLALNGLALILVLHVMRRLAAPAHEVTPVLPRRAASAA